MKVTIYTTPTCSYCNMAKNYLKKRKVKFKEIDVSKDEKARNEMIKKSGRMGVPQIIIDDKVIVGFDSEVIAAALKKK